MNKHTTKQNFKSMLDGKPIDTGIFGALMRGSPVGARCGAGGGGEVGYFDSKRASQIEGFIGRGVLIAALLGGSLVLPANAANATTPQEKITATISPEVREQLQKLESGERKKMEAAIGVGNRYAPYHFDGRAYVQYQDDEKKFWNKNIRPLVMPLKIIDDWGWIDDILIKSADKLKINGVQAIPLDAVVCPQPVLISILAIGDDVELGYRTKIIGKWRNESKRGLTDGDIILDQKEQFDGVLLLIDKANKVSRATTKYDELPSVPWKGIRRFEAYIKRPPMRIYQGSEHAEQETEDQARARIPQYKKYIELIKSEEAAACGGTSGNSKKTQDRE